MNTAKRRKFKPSELALVAASLQPLVAQLAIDVEALRSVMRGPDPQFALRVVCDVRDTLDEQVAAVAAAVRHLAPRR